MQLTALDVARFPIGLIDNTHFPLDKKIPAQGDAAGERVERSCLVVATDIVVRLA